MNKETFQKLAKDFTDLSKPIATEKLAVKLQKHVKVIYYVLSAFLVFGFVRAFVSLFTGNISLAILDMMLTGIYFIILRLFGELLVMAKLPEPTVTEKQEQKTEKKSEGKAE